MIMPKGNEIYHAKIAQSFNLTLKWDDMSCHEVEKNKRKEDRPFVKMDILSTERLAP